MCGIAGIFFFGNSGGLPPRDQTMAILSQMNRAQKHRGPDDDGLWISKDGRIGLSHTRLSIIDLSSDGKQPMSNEDNKIWISFNGEIYNFEPLRMELKSRGHIFRSRTDTEVIIHAYEEWGTDSFSLLRGMYAFALWDDNLSQLYLVKDRFGIKPLYYYINDDFLVFASEVRALTSSNIFNPQKDNDALLNFLLTGSIPLPKTSVKNVKGLLGGQYLILKNGNIDLQNYYDIENDFKGMKIACDLSYLRSTLEDAVKIHLISDAPLGIFLSGGIDSSSIVALAALSAERELVTLSVIFEEESYSEVKYQHLISQCYKTDHREINISKKIFWEKIPEVFEAMDQPTIDGINTYFVSYAAKCAGLKVVLSGTGGDEVFCGYNHFKNFYKIRILQAIKNIGRNFDLLFSKFPGKINKLSFLKINDDIGTYLVVRGLFNPREIADLTGYDLSYIINNAPKLIKNNHNLDLLNRFTKMEFMFYLQNQLLKDIDFMSMAHSIEVRVPFLDPVVVRTILQLPSDKRIEKGIPKPLLVKPLEDLLPAEIVYRPKMTFAFPMNQWLGKDNFNINKLSGLFSKKAVTKVWNDFQVGKAIWAKPWALNIAQMFFGDN